MKHKLIISLLAITLYATDVIAQGPPNQASCAIQYFYDAAGNRIKRKWVCTNPNQNQLVAPLPQTNTLDMVVYPNPASNFITIDLTQALSNANVELQDITGKIIAVETLTGNSVSFDMRTLAQGAYMVVLKRKDTKEVLVRKVVKE